MAYLTPILFVSLNLFPSSLQIMCLFVMLTVGGPGMYHVISCGPSGHNIRCKASLKASAIGMMVSGNVLKVIADVSFSTFYLFSLQLFV